MVDVEEFKGLIIEVEVEAMQTEDDIMDCEGWSQKEEKKTTRGWKDPNKTWFNRIVKKMEENGKLNR